MYTAEILATNSTAPATEHPIIIAKLSSVFSTKEFMPCEWTRHARVSLLTHCLSLNEVWPVLAGKRIYLTQDFGHKRIFYLEDLFIGE